MAEHGEEMLGKSGGMESLIRIIQIKDGYMKNMKVQPVDPKDILDMQSLTPKFYCIRKKLPWQSP